MEIAQGALYKRHVTKGCGEAGIDVSTFLVAAHGGPQQADGLE